MDLSSLRKVTLHLAASAKERVWKVDLSTMWTSLSCFVDTLDTAVTAEDLGIFLAGLVRGLSWFGLRAGNRDTKDVLTHHN